MGMILVVGLCTKTSSFLGAKILDSQSVTMPTTYFQMVWPQIFIVKCRDACSLFSNGLVSKILYAHARTHTHTHPVRKGKCSKILIIGKSK